MKERLVHKRLTKPPEAVAVLRFQYRLTCLQKESHISQMQLRIYIVTCGDPVNCVAAGHACKQDVLKNTGIYEVSLPSTTAAARSKATLEDRRS